MTARQDSDPGPALEEAMPDHEQTPLLPRESATETATSPLSYRRGMTILLAMGILIFIQGTY
jgi:hypothetical protein